MPSCCQCEAIDRHFAAARAADELATYARRGPTGTSRLILNALRELSSPIDTLLDIGAGIGVLHHELIGTGTRSALHVEVASAYIDAARDESARRGHVERLRFVHGDFLALAPSIGSADLVTLDRVVCCYAAPSRRSPAAPPPRRPAAYPNPLVTELSSPGKGHAIGQVLG